LFSKDFSVGHASLDGMANRPVDFLDVSFSSVNLFNSPLSSDVRKQIQVLAIESQPAILYAERKA
jgi:hypothetical protein